MAGILLIRRKTQNNQSFNPIKVNVFCRPLSEHGYINIYENIHITIHPQYIFS